MITGNELVPLLAGGGPVKISALSGLPPDRRIPLIRGGSRFRIGNVASLSDYARVPLVSGGLYISGKALKDYMD